jgi:hypothetical protein
MIIEINDPTIIILLLSLSAGLFFLIIGRLLEILAKLKKNVQDKENEQ